MSKNLFEKYHKVLIIIRIYNNNNNNNNNINKLAY